MAAKTVELRLRAIISSDCDTREVLYENEPLFPGYLHDFRYLINLLLTQCVHVIVNYGRGYMPSYAYNGLTLITT